MATQRNRQEIIDLLNQCGGLSYQNMVDFLYSIVFLNEYETGSFDGFISRFTGTWSSVYALDGKYDIDYYSVKDNVIYRSTVNNNTSTPGASGTWTPISSGTELASFDPTVVADGGTLPVHEDPAWLFVGAGTYNKPEGGTIVTTEPLNIIATDGLSYFIVLSIPIDLNGYLKDEDVLKVTLSSGNLFNKADFRDNTTVSSTTGALITSGAVGNQTTKDILIPEGETHCSWSGLTTTAHRIACYSDTTGTTFISANINSLSQGTFEFPDGSKMFRFVFRHSSDTLDVKETFALSFGTEIPTLSEEFLVITRILNTPIASEYVLKEIPTEEMNPISLSYFNKNVSPLALKKSDVIYERVSIQLFNKDKWILPDVTVSSTLGTGFQQNAGTVGFEIAFYPAKPLTKYTISGHGTARSQIAFMKGIFPETPSIPNPSDVLASGNAVDLGGTKAGSVLSFTTVADTTYVAVVIKAPAENVSVYSQLMVVEGGISLPNEPYEEAIIKILNKDVISGKSTLGKMAVLFGDSITETRNINGFSRSNWPIFASPKLGWIWSNYAKSGAGFVHTVAPDYPEQWLSVQIDHAEDDALTPDIVVVSLGTNDLNDVLGSYDVAMGKSIGSLDMTITLDSARANFYRLRNLYPNAVFYYALPIQRASNELSTMLTLINELRKMAQRYGFIVIEATYESGIVKDYETVGVAGRFLYDGLHPNQSGQKMMSDCYVKRILSTYL